MAQMGNWGDYFQEWISDGWREVVRMKGGNVK